MATDPIPGYSEFRSSSAGRAYNEAAFRHFLAIDRRRAQRSMRSLLLALITIRRQTAADASLAEATAAAIFAGLGRCLREADFVGWYREGRIPAAVLVLGATSAADARQRATERIMQALTKQLTADQLSTLRLRVVRLGSKVRP